MQTFISRRDEVAQNLARCETSLRCAVMRMMKYLDYKYICESDVTWKVFKTIKIIIENMVLLLLFIYKLRKI